MVIPVSNSPSIFGWLGGDVYTYTQSMTPVTTYVAIIMAIQQLQVYNVSTAAEYWAVDNAIAGIKRIGLTQVGGLFNQVSVNLFVILFFVWWVNILFNLIIVRERTFTSIRSSLITTLEQPTSLVRGEAWQSIFLGDSYSKVYIYTLRQVPYRNLLQK